MAWTKEQEEAINTDGKDILVSAAAGSGKTAVLVERIIRLVLEKGIDINEILVVTFTNAAAAEMRERIGKRLTEELTAAAEKKDTATTKKLERQLILLNAASISTLHAFCQNIVRHYFHKIDIDPKFRLAGEQEITLLQQDVLSDLIEAQYDTENNSMFLQFADSYGSERGDETVGEIILSLYQYAMSQPFPKEWLTKLPEYFCFTDTSSIDDSSWAGIMHEELEKTLTACNDINISMQERVAGSTVAAIENDHDLLDKLADTAKLSWQDIYILMQTVNFTSLRLPKDMAEQTKIYLKNARRQIKDTLNSLINDFFQMPPAELFADLKSQRKNIAFICQLTIEFLDAFAKAKHDRVIVDFNDLEHFALQILADDSSTAQNLIPTDAADKLSEKFKEIMVDEYQDTNGVQEAIITLVSDNNHNKFLVGDVKQSIYRFRLAEPALFMNKYRTYPTHPDTCKRIDLSKNFRSCNNVLLAINFLFSQLMTPQAAEINYGEKEALVCGLTDAPPENSIDDAVELLLLDKSNSLEEKSADLPEDEAKLVGFTAEADCIAKRITKLINDGKKIFDKESGNYRPVTYRDIVILLRSAAGKADKLLDTLRNNNIPSYANLNSGYFAETEIKTILSLLQIIDNPRQDIPLAAVLYSPIIKFSVEELAKIKLLCPTGNLFDALLAVNNPDNDISTALKDKSVQFLYHLNRWRTLSRQLSVPELIWRLYDETSYYDYCGAMPGGVLRQANLRMLYDRAAAYEETNYRGLFRFLRFVGKMQKTGNDLSVARTLGENENVVRIMTIHKSKGLEFPVVILADLGKKINLADSRQALLIHKKYGLGPYIYDLKYNVRYPTVARQAIARQIIKESKAEELRVLYVAMTRAREKLILVGSLNNLKQKLTDYCQMAEQTDGKSLPTYQIQGANTYLDWLCPAIARHSDSSIFYQLADSSITQISALPYNKSHWQIKIEQYNTTVANKKTKKDLSRIFQTIAKLQPLPSTDAKDWVDARLSWRYQQSTDAYLPAKLSVTEIKRRFEPTPDAENLFNNNEYIRPRFLQEKEQMTGMEYGTLMHSVMQHLDLHADLSDNGIKEQLANMAREEIIAPEQIPHINRRSIRNFCFSELGKRTRRSPNIRREMQFSRMLLANKFYDDAPPDRQIFIQGVIDLLFSEGNDLVLVDYKTDNCTEDEACEKYRLQINLYSSAVEAILKKNVKEKYLYLFHSGKVVQIK